MSTHFPSRADIAPVLQRKATARRQSLATVAGGLGAALLMAGAILVFPTETVCPLAQAGAGGAHGPHSHYAPTGACSCGTQAQAPTALSSTCRE